MRLINFFRRPTTTAPVARERLQLLLAHERAVSGKSDLIAILQEEIMAVIARHFPVEQEGITVKMERGEVVSTLEVEVEIPTPMCPSFPLPARPAKAVPTEPPAREDVDSAEAEEADEEVDDAMARTGT
jgi:cell division topological specificity factor